MVIEMLGGGVWVVNRINATTRLRGKGRGPASIRAGATW